MPKRKVASLFAGKKPKALFGNASKQERQKFKSRKGQRKTIIELPKKVLGTHPERYFLKPKEKKFVRKEKPVRSSSNPVRVWIGYMRGKNFERAFEEGIRNILKERGLDKFFQIEHFGFAGPKAVIGVNRADIVVSDPFVTGLLYKQWAKKINENRYEQQDNIIRRNIKKRGANIHKYRKQLKKKIILVDITMIRTHQEKEHEKVVDAIIEKVRKEFRLVKD
ncbi:MAG: hypothetical protein Q7S21_06155 [archaeon]|nr:hypothetical protein [archaeon]